MAEETKKPATKKETKKIVAKPLPVDKEKAKEIEEQMKQIKQAPEEKKESQEKEPAKVEEKVPEKKEEKPAEKKEVKKVEIKKKEEAIANGISLPISKKHSMYLCSFIKNKKIDDAIKDLEQVVKMKRAVPFKGEIPHRKGNIERGRYPVKAAGHFINLLKGLKGNVLTNQMELEETRIYLASASWANRPMRRGGVAAKRTNIILKAKEFPEKVQTKKANKEEKK